MLAHRLIGEQLAKQMVRTGVRMDAAVATAFTARELEYVKTKTYDVTKIAMKARQFIPVSFEANPGAEVISYDQWDTMGEAKIVEQYSRDFPRVDAERQNFSTKVFSIGASYGYSIQDLRAIAMSNSRLNVMRAMQARRAMEMKLEKIAVSGVPALGKTGFVNDANVNVFATALDWDFSTPAQDIYRGLNALVASVIDQSEQIWEPDTLLMGTKHYQIASQVPFGVDNEKSVLKAFLENSPYIRNVGQWVQLNGAGVGGTDRMVVYPRNSDVIELEIPQDYEEMAPEIRGMEFVIFCHMRVGGVVVRYPLAMQYADGTADITTIV